ncbi:hypothetical protein [uncultured Microbacterium sp.]|uniref:hypothetical protein n=1 Tax=uncultured Microbacterium sp. TaxID=191216 RepID=UPI0025FC16C2|nr:hypothetical protein [uncultured Microbacterium sp.]
MAGFIQRRQIGVEYEDVRVAIADEAYLADVVAVVLLGQAQHAANLINELDTVSPAFLTNDLVDSAIEKVRIASGNADEIKARTEHRDGLLFEILSWIGLIEANSGKFFIARDPHLGATTQGLDGLLLHLDPHRRSVKRTVILEDKCSTNPRKTFRSKVMPAFKDHHAMKRSPDLVAAAASLLRELPDASQAVAQSAAVLDLKRRGYRASLAIDSVFDTKKSRQKLFEGYEELSGLSAADREGDGFVVGQDLRRWFHRFAQRVDAVLQAQRVTIV